MCHFTTIPNCTHHGISGCLLTGFGYLVESWIFSVKIILYENEKDSLWNQIPWIPILVLPVIANTALENLSNLLIPTTFLFIEWEQL